ncbi:MAG: division/cell wall cluster transcriptional repressor MraZ [Elusimicrobiota bacterium]|jgi:MraZ protein
MFLGGEYRHSLDDKRRVFIPARLRGDQKTFVMARGLEGCLSLYKEDAWKRLLEKLQDLPVSDKAHARAFRRLLISGATQAEADGQGRLLVPESLGRYAGIKKDVMVIGMETHIEVWSKERWESYRRAAEKSAARIAQQIDL